ncbi:hypothetical protein GGG17_08880 [Arsenicicoccus sp. MKL-02]|uniref:DUF1023 domain-containing protein n=1 Tax=Arsenicicoccus cauae TaxID=2663847 RepID=A0A6I3ITY5_9MICO|nr:alpha/beta hydrolase [Arsenicicoccus cauae]MTB72079.1 hypothetical protein [Arsenicicoccus cauae]
MAECVETPGGGGPPAGGPGVEPLTLQAGLAAAADAVEQAVAAATTAHLHLTEALAADRTWSRPGDAVLDEIMTRRTDVGLYAAGQLVDQLRSEAEVAASRFPRLGMAGEEVLPIPRDDAPDVVAAWWRGLAPEDREEVLRRHAPWAGRADGLPTAVRHAANLQVLEAEIARRSRELDVDTGAPADEATVEEERDLRGLLKLRALFADPDLLAEVPEGLAQVSTLPTRRFLYLLDARSYPLRTAIALGDPDTATHVVVHVPGTTTTVDLRLYREATWMSWLRDEAVRLLDGDARVAVIDWIGYRAPYDIATRKALGDTGMRVLVPGEASDPRYAREAAGHLARTLQGVREITPAGARVVASGHSYGASAMGLALSQLAAGGAHVVDAAMTAGAPGIFASSLSDLGLAPGTLYACIAPGDLIGMLGVFGGEVLRIGGVQQLSPLARRVVYPDGSWTVLRPPVGHEQYYHRGTSSLLHLAAVAAGDTERIKLMRRPWSMLTGGSSGPAEAGSSGDSGDSGGSVD